MLIENFRKFFQLKSAAGILLLVAAIAAILVENSFLSDSYSITTYRYVIDVCVQQWGVEGVLYRWIKF
jgi:Na+/H+ antiporter NhaA